MLLSWQKRFAFEVSPSYVELSILRSYESRGVLHLHWERKEEILDVILDSSGEVVFAQDEDGPIGTCSKSEIRELLKYMYPYQN